MKTNNFKELIRPKADFHLKGLSRPKSMSCYPLGDGEMFHPKVGLTQEAFDSLWKYFEGASPMGMIAEIEHDGLTEGGIPINGVVVAVRDYNDKVPIIVPDADASEIRECISKHGYGAFVLFAVSPEKRTGFIMAKSGKTDADSIALKNQIALSLSKPQNRELLQYFKEAILAAEKKISESGTSNEDQL